MTATKTTPSSTPVAHAAIPRRTMFQALGALLLAGCGDHGATGTTDTTGTTGTTTGDTSSSGGITDPTTGDLAPTSTTDATSTGDDACGDPAPSWASGGTAAMTAKDCYPDPFAGALPACALFCETTPGPCTADTLERQDISEGLAGLPVRLALRIVDVDTCAPVEDARVEVWHTQRTGVYSGETPGGPNCFVNDPDAPNHLYFRGTQTTGADGRVDFDTCFPGWYAGRAIHIHIRIRRGDVAFATSQLFFDDALVAEIFAGHPDYLEFGQPNTTNVTDSIFGGAADPKPYTLTVARMPDGAMLASKAIAIRSALAQPSCAV